MYGMRKAPAIFDKESKLLYHTENKQKMNQNDMVELKLPW